ncbi:ATP-binding cassette domain-containing protein [Lactobacillus ultunensis]|uniref:ATP-binding cassette domain-containing protein n=1 Tax=Lactobacillus ultunensis TaxID=227945 RepID=UPI001911B570|nr:ABC transporter ATP-binding protein [Lactobacillus ultunensis]QQP29519.1 ABC transporter ATP-binding protein [Lactobacillus ultunensis]
MNIKALFRVNKSQFILIFVMVILATIADSASQYLMTPAFNHLKNLNFIGFSIFIVLSLSCDLIRVLLSSSSDYLYSKQNQTYLHDIRAKISRYFFKNDFEKTATIQNQMVANLDQLTKNYLKPWKMAFFYALEVIFSIGILFSYNWILVVLTLILTTISLFLPKTFEKMTSSATLRMTKKNEQLLNTVAKWVKGLDELRRYASFGIYQESISKANADYQTAAIHQGATHTIAELITSGVNILGQMILMAVCAYLYFHGQIVFGAVITTIQFCVTVMNGASLFVSQWNLVESTQGLRDEIGKLQSSVQISVDHHCDQKIHKLEVKNLSLKFENGESITYPDFVVKQGEKVLLTGDSGTGKSTLFKLILGKLKPTRGQVAFKDKDDNLINLNQDELGYIAQDGTLFPDTIENNITMFNSSLNSQVKSAIVAVNFAQDLAKMSQGLEQRVDLDNENLSGGQKQKIILARAIVHHRKWILIDEGTSAIDSQATKEILKNLLKSDSTIIMIAHNFSQDLVDMFDRKIELENRGEKA